jgi:hypothetical protein
VLGSGRVRRRVDWMGGKCSPNTFPRAYFVFFLPGALPGRNNDSDNITFHNSTMTAVAHSSPHFVLNPSSARLLRRGAWGLKPR